MDAFIIIMTVLFFLFVVGIYQKLNVIASAFRKGFGDFDDDKDVRKLSLAKGDKGNEKDRNNK